MPIFSYLAYPAPGAKAALLADLRALEYCDVVPAENEDLLILITDTPNDAAETLLQEKFKQMTSLQSLSMTFGHTDHQTDDA